jgi:FMN-dependent oxidoreductase (nitrilotriacetate monooxygenase family)
MTKPFHLAFFLADSHAQSWNKPWSGNIGTEWMNPDLYVAVARELERAGFDYILLEDNLYIPDAYNGTMDIYLENGLSTPRREPMIVAPYMTQATKHIGIVPTVSTFAMHPYLLARQLGTLDQLSGGRTGWNVVTGSSDRAVQNFGFESMEEHDRRYDMAAEFVDLANALWDSWQPGAVVADRASGLLIDPTKVHTVDFRGKFYASRGPLNSGPLPQGRPIVAQAGSSGKGRQFAAKYADTIVVEARNIAYAKQYRQEVREQAAAIGRNPDSIKLMLLVSPIIATSEAEAAEQARLRAELDARNAEHTLAIMSKMTSINFGQFPLDEPLSSEGLSTNGTQQVLQDFVERNEGRTLREAGAMAFGSGASDVNLVGTPEAVAAEMDEIMQEVGGDGFLLSARVTRRYLAELTDGLVPALQDRGLVRTEYTADTLRGNLMAF